MKKNNFLLDLLDGVRIIVVCFAFYWGYRIGFVGPYNPIAQLHFMIPVLITAVAGISGIEGLFFGKASAMNKGFEMGSNYQKQSAIALLSYAVVALIICFMNWGIYAELTILFAFIFFFFFSGVNHAIDAVRRKNYKWQNINRPFITLLLIAGLIYPVAKALSTP
jgi:hypothetical protein